ncbi:MAG: hypothetical protein ABL912_08825 [Novosphingobium sp.]
MATPHYYVPLLRWRMGEYQALEKLNDACKERTVPLIEVLVWKPVQCVSLSLDFETADVTVDYGNIDPAGSMIESQFVDHQRIGAGLGMGQETPVGGLSHIAVPKRF